MKSTHLDFQSNPFLQWACLWKAILSLFFLLSLGNISKLFWMTLQAEILWEDHCVYLLGYTFRIQSVKPSPVTSIGAVCLFCLNSGCALNHACTCHINCVDCGFLSCISLGQFQECYVDPLECIFWTEEMILTTDVYSCLMASLIT